MKESKIFKLLTKCFTLVSLVPLTMSITNCGNSQKKSSQYPQIVHDVVNELVELNKNPRCTSDKKQRQYLDAVRSFIKNKSVNAGINWDDICEDEYGNVWFDVSASEGCEEYEPLILQGHMDMVVAGLTEEEKTVTPIETEIDWNNGLVHSKDYKTSLGADDGFGISTILALIKDKTIKHGPLRIFCSADEDSGMIGAQAHYKQFELAGKNAFTNMGKDFSGKDIKYLLNIDAEALGDVYRSCAGSITYKFEKELEPSKVTLPKSYKINIKGFKGGHSGGDINKNRASADKCIFELLHEINQTLDIELVKNYHPEEQADGEEKDISFQRNQIVPHATAIFNIEDADTPKTIENAIAKCKTKWEKLYLGEDWTNVTISAEQLFSPVEHCVSKEDSKKYIEVIGTNNGYGTTTGTKSIWYGYISDGKAKYTKSANIAPVELKFNAQTNKFDFKVNSQFRTIGQSNFDEMKSYYENVLIDGITKTLGSEYKPWTKDEDNKMVKISMQAFANAKVKGNIVDSEGGVEPTWWMQCNPNLNCTCIGATITNAHSVYETLYINTIQPVISAIVEIFNAMKAI